MPRDAQRQNGAAADGAVAPHRTTRRTVTSASKPSTTTTTTAAEAGAGTRRTRQGTTTQVKKASTTTSSSGKAKPRAKKAEEKVASTHQLESNAALLRSTSPTTVSANQDFPAILSPHGRHPSGGAEPMGLMTFNEMMGSLSGTYNVSPNTPTPNLLDNRSPGLSHSRRRRGQHSPGVASPGASVSSPGDPQASLGVSQKSEGQSLETSTRSAGAVSGRPRGRQNAPEMMREKHRERVREARKQQQQKAAADLEESNAAAETPHAIDTAEPSPAPDFVDSTVNAGVESVKESALEKSEKQEEKVEEKPDEKKPEEKADNDPSAPSPDRAYEKPWLINAAKHSRSTSIDVAAADAAANDGSRTRARAKKPAEKPTSPDRRARARTRDAQKSTAAPSSPDRRTRSRRGDDASRAEDGANSSSRRERSTARTAPGTNKTTDTKTAAKTRGSVQPNTSTSSSRRRTRDEANESSLTINTAPIETPPVMHPTFVRLESGSVASEIHERVVQSVSTSLYDGIYTELADCEEAEIAPVFERPLSYYEQLMVRRHGQNTVAHYQVAMAKRKKSLRQENSLMPLTTYGGVAGGGVVEDLKHMARVVRYCLEEENWRIAMEALSSFQVLCAKLLAPTHRPGETLDDDDAKSDVEGLSKLVAPGGHASGDFVVSSVSSRSLQFRIEDPSEQPSPMARQASAAAAVADMKGAHETSFSPLTPGVGNADVVDSGPLTIEGATGEKTSGGAHAKRRRRGPVAPPVAPVSVCPIMHLVSFSRFEVGQELKRMVWWCAVHRLARFSVSVGVAAGGDALSTAGSSFAGPSTADVSYPTLPSGPSPVLHPAAHPSHRRYREGQHFSVFYDTVVLLLCTDLWLRNRVDLFSRSRVEGLITIAILPSALEEARAKDWAHFRSYGKPQLEQYAQRVAQNGSAANLWEATASSKRRDSVAGAGASFSSAVDDAERFTEAGSPTTRMASPPRDRRKDLPTTSGVSFFA